MKLLLNILYKYMKKYKYMKRIHCLKIQIYEEIHRSEG